MKEYGIRSDMEKVGKKGEKMTKGKRKGIERKQERKKGGKFKKG